MAKRLKVGKLTETGWLDLNTSLEAELEPGRQVPAAAICAKSVDKIKKKHDR